LRRHPRSAENGAVIRLVEIAQDGSPSEPGLSLEPAAHEALAATAALYGRAGFEPPWIGYLAVEAGRCVGTCAFKGAPRGGRVEIAYFTFPEHEGRRLATSMAAALVDIAGAAAPGVMVIAQTLQEEGASTRVLSRLGFQRAGSADDPQAGRVWEWHLAPR